jgi:hypothetical protein
MASAHGGRSRPPNSFYAIADGDPISVCTIASNGPALSSSDEGDAGSCLLLGGPVGETSATKPGYCTPRGTWDSAGGPMRSRKLVIGLEIRGEFKKLVCQGLPGRI